MKNRQDIEKYYENMSRFKRKCECGHTIYLSKTHPKEQCSWCKKMNYYDEKEQFINDMKNKLFKEE